MTTRKEIVNALNVKEVSETYPGNVQITDLRKELGTKGHVLVVRGDLAYSDRLGENAHLANPKFWMYGNLVNSQRIQEQLRAHPDHKLFDGVGYSSLEALGYHAKRLGRKAVVVMAYEHVPDDETFDRYDIEVIHGEKPAEQGYVEKQIEILSMRNDLIPIHQALHGAQALAPVGNAVVKKLEEMDFQPDETFWCMASGSNLYGIGAKIKERFGSRTVVVEPRRERTIDPSLDLTNSDEVKSFARGKLRDYSLDHWDRINSGVFPLHIAHPNKYLLLNWLQSGDTGFDKTVGVNSGKVNKLQRTLRDVSPDCDWTKTTALTLAPAIQAAKHGKDVLVMSYGKDRENKFRGTIRIEDIPWILRNETPVQRVASVAAVVGYTALSGLAMQGFSSASDEVMKYMPFIG